MNYRGQSTRTKKKRTFYFTAHQELECPLFFACLLAILGSTAIAAEPVNLAPKATASATSEHNARYLARFAIDGKIPPAGSKTADLSAAWCVLKEKSGDRAEFILQWPAPVEVGEVVYWGRTAWFLSECWKDYELYLDDQAEPVVRGTFQQRHGPQRVSFPQATVGKLRLKFLNSHGGFNPGAAEIQVFSQPVSDAFLARLTRKTNAGLAAMPSVDQHDPEAIRSLIDELATMHGPRHADVVAELRQRVDQIEKQSDNDNDTLESLERDVLLFDIDKLLVIKRHEITASHVYTYHYEGFRAGGGLYVVSLNKGSSDPTAEPEALELVASPTGQILDCELSYDGGTILFSWRRTQDEGYHLWTIRPDGTGLTRLTDGVWHDYNGCWLPDGDIAFLSTRSPQFAYCWHAPVGILHRMAADGSNVQKLSSNYLNDFTPAVLEDGRLIYSRWEYVDRPAIPIQSMWTLNPDGTGLSVFFGNRVLSPGTFMEARSIPGTSRVICTMTGHNGPTRGAIGVIDRSYGVNAQAGITNVTPDVPVPNVDQGNGNTGGTKQYSGPWPLDHRRFMVSIRGPLLVRTYSGDCQAVVLEAPSDGMQWLAARPLAARNRPPVIASTLPERLARFEEERGQADGDQPDYRELLTANGPPATVVLQDVYNGLGPEVARGQIARIRVVRELPKTVRIDPSRRAFGFQFPVISCGATYAGKQVLGEVDVEADGSAAFDVPSGVPLYFMALDAEGRALQRMRSFTHLMPGEVQGCVGCHEHRRQTLRGVSASALTGRVQRLHPPEWGTEGFDYARIVQPVLDRHCVECHHPTDAPARVDLSGGRTDFFNVSYDVLARENQGGRGSPYVNWIPSYNGQEWNILEVRPKTWGSPASPLAELIRSGHPDAEGKRRVTLDETDRQRIFAWIDLNVPYYGSSETAYPDGIGCRRIYPTTLDVVLAEVAGRRCVECHAGGKIPRREWTRVTEPEGNPFLTAPLSTEAGGSGRCGKPVFADKNDPDYQAILAAFTPVQKMLAETPRLDMPGGTSAPEVCRICQ